MNRTAASSWSPAEVVEIARRQRQILWLILLGLVGLVIPFAVLVIGLIQVYFVVKLASSLRSRAPWLYIVPMFIPYISLLTLLFLNRKATAAIRSHGLSVGLMGVSESDIGRFTAELHGPAAAPGRY